MKTATPADVSQARYVTEIGYPRTSAEVLHSLFRPMPEPLPDPEPEAEL